MKTTCILLLASLLLTLGCAKPNPLGSEAQAGPFKVKLTTNPDPPVAGEVELIVTATHADGGQLDATAAVSAVSNQKGSDVSNPAITLTRLGDQYSGKLSIGSGTWQVKITINSGGKFGDATFEFTVN